LNVKKFKRNIKEIPKLDYDLKCKKTFQDFLLKKYKMISTFETNGHSINITYSTFKIASPKKKLQTNIEKITSLKTDLKTKLDNDTFKRVIGCDTGIVIQTQFTELDLDTLKNSLKNLKNSEDTSKDHQKFNPHLKYKSKFRITNKAVKHVTGTYRHLNRLKRLKKDQQFFFELNQRNSSTLNNQYKDLNEVENSIISPKIYHTYNDHIMSFFSVFPILNKFYSSRYNISRKFDNYIKKQKFYSKFVNKHFPIKLKDQTLILWGSSKINSPFIKLGHTIGSNKDILKLVSKSNNYNDS
jgi:hypothetical protein